MLIGLQFIAVISFRIGEPLKNLSENQRKSVLLIQDEIKWLLRDEICTALLDVDTVNLDTLQYVMKHVSESSSIHSTCLLDVVKLNFVYDANQSHEKFVEEFSTISLPYGGYKLCKIDGYYYLAKDSGDLAAIKDGLSKSDQGLSSLSGNNQYDNEVKEYFRNEYYRELNFQGLSSQPSEISSMVESAAGTDGGEC